MKELGMSQKVFGNSGMEDPQVLKIAQGAAEGVPFVTYQGQISDAFVQKAKAKFGHAPLRWSAESYDGLKIIALAASRINGKITPELLREQLAQIKSYDGESGKFEFDNDGNAVRPPRIKRVQNENFVMVE
jgi:branched-chain amino acid transport system substrate-binding protein